MAAEQPRPAPPPAPAGSLAALQVTSLDGPAAALYRSWRAVAADGASSGPRRRAAALLWERAPTPAVRRLAASQLVSRAGSNGAIIALQYLVLTHTDSTGWVAASLLAHMGVRLLAAPVAGLLGDRVDRRRLLIGSELAGGAVWLGCVFVSAPAGLVVLSGLAAAAQAPFRPAAAGAIPRLVAHRDLARANASFSSADAAGLVIGPPLAGVLIAVASAQAVFAINVATFAISALLLRGLAGDFRPAPRDGRPSRGLDGARLVARHPDLRLVAIVAGAVLASSGLVNVAEPQLAALLGSPGLSYGLLSGGWAIGSLFGARLAAGPGAAGAGEERTAWGLLAAAAATAAIAAGSGLALSVGLMIAMGIGMGTFLVTQLTAVQTHAPDRLISRAAAAIDAAGSLCFVAGVGAAAVVVPAIGIRASYLSAATLLAAAVLPAIILARRAGPRRDRGPRAAARRIASLEP